MIYKKGLETVLFFGLIAAKRLEFFMACCIQNFQIIRLKSYINLLNEGIWLPGEVQFS
jgi:hypothetical protein